MAEEKKEAGVLWGKIVNGPNRWDLIIRSLCQGVQVQFDIILTDKDGLKEKVTMQLPITGIDADRRGENCDHWIIRGHADYPEREVFCQKFDPDLMVGKSVYFYARYSTDDRDGKIKFYLSTERFIERIDMELTLA